MYSSTVIPSVRLVEDSYKTLIERMDQLVITFNQYDNMPDKKASLQLANALAPKMFQLYKEDIAFGCYYFSRCVRYYNAKSYLGQTILLILRKMAHEEHDVESIYMLAELYRVNYAPLKTAIIEAKGHHFVLNRTDAYYELGAFLGCKKCQERIHETKAYSHAKYVLIDNCSNEDLKYKRDMEQISIMEDLVINHNRADLLSDYALWLQTCGLYSRLVALCDFYLSDPDYEDKGGALQKKRDRYKKEAMLEKLQYYIYKIFTVASFIIPVVFIFLYFQKLPFNVTASMAFIIYLVLSYLAPAPLYPFKMLFHMIFGGIQGVANDDTLLDCLLIYSLLR